MLEPDSRVVLLDQLRPPPGYRLHAAVATTFTLDLATAVVPSLAFALSFVGVWWWVVWAMDRRGWYLKV